MYFETEMKGSSDFVHNLLFLNINFFITENTDPFWNFLSGILDLIITATGDSGIGEKMNAISWKALSEGVRICHFRAQRSSLQYFFPVCLHPLKYLASNKKLMSKWKWENARKQNVSVTRSFIFTAVMMIFCYFWAIWSIDPYIYHWNIIIVLG